LLHGGFPPSQHAVSGIPGETNGVPRSSRTLPGDFPRYRFRNSLAANGPFSLPDGRVLLPFIGSFEEILLFVFVSLILGHIDDLHAVIGTAVLANTVCGCRAV